MTYPKYFGIGLTRTGSKSLAIAMSMLGHTVKHNPEFYDIKDFQFTNDIVITTRYKFLDHYYPEAKFILTVRDVDLWLESCRAHIRRGTYKDGVININLRRAEHRFLMFGICHFDKTQFRGTYWSFMEDIENHFWGREDKLLTMDICADDGWEKLCPFVGRPIPSIPFPHRHSRMKKTVV